jgi:hypothetical protein
MSDAITYKIYVETNTGHTAICEGDLHAIQLIETALETAGLRFINSQSCWTEEQATRPSLQEHTKFSGTKQEQ